MHERDRTSLSVDAATLARRAFLAASALFVTGCATSNSTKAMPGAEWPGGRYDDAPPPPAAPPTNVPAPKPGPQVRSTPEPIPIGGVIPRSRWASSGPDVNDINPMLPVKYLTIHHEGWEPFTAVDFGDTAARIERVRVGHSEGRGYADIGYHFIIDREGRIWEGRSLKFQGAHVKHHNEGNIGIMCLGNFEEQSPTPKQLAGLNKQVRVVMARYKISVKRVYTHQEWADASTLCPGRNLQVWVDKKRPQSFA